MHTSSKAILEKLYDFNHQLENWEIKPYAPKSHKTRSLHDWGSGLACRSLQAIYAIVFICLLQSDKVLKICWEHIVYKATPEPQYVLTLPFWKTHQDGSTFLLYLQPHLHS